jgi:hypothetical protein
MRPCASALGVQSCWRRPSILVPRVLPQLFPRARLYPSRAGEGRNKSAPGATSQLRAAAPGSPSVLGLRNIRRPSSRFRPRAGEAPRGIEVGPRGRAVSSPRQRDRAMRGGLRELPSASYRPSCRLATAQRGRGGRLATDPTTTKRAVGVRPALEIGLRGLWRGGSTRARARPPQQQASVGDADGLGGLRTRNDQARNRAMRSALLQLSSPQASPGRAVRPRHNKLGADAPVAQLDRAARF